MTSGRKPSLTRRSSRALSFAEVEFENGSTARLGQLSELDFTNLSLSPDGSKINHLTLAQGYASFTVIPRRGDVYVVHAAGSAYKAADKTMFRVDLQDAGQRLEVFKGKVEAQSPYGNGLVAKNQELQIVPGSSNPFQITNGVTEDAWDKWVAKRQQTETVASNHGTNHGVGNSLYGWSDLAYYGAWTNLPGYGSCWAPSMGAGWSPYSIGRWAWYPGFGYTWISALAWGWLPFHYGSWINPAGFGWCWQPGGFSTWSPGLVTWYQGPGWIGWAPRNYVGASGARPVCRPGQVCSTAVSLNTFQRGRQISPRDVLRVNPFRGRSVNSPTIPLTRTLRLPGPAVAGAPFTTTMRRAAGAPGGARLVTSPSATRLRVRRIGAAPNRVFAAGSIRGTWNVKPHAARAFNMQTRHLMNGTRPATSASPNGAVAGKPGKIVGSPSGRPANSFRGNRTVNNDMLRPSRMAVGRTIPHTGTHPAQLTSIPVSNLGARKGAMRHSSSLAPSARTTGNEVQMPTFPQRRMRNSHRNGFPSGNRSTGNIGNAQSRSQRQMNRRSGMSQPGVQRAPASRPSSRGFGGGGMMNRSSGRMGGGMRSSSPGGMGGGMRSSPPRSAGGGMRQGGSSPHGPHH
ncbi:MAG: FecR family protein [Acidobacteriota bacterium]